MKQFTALFVKLDSTNKTSAKLAALRDYFSSCPPRDAAWVVKYFIGKRPQAPIRTAQIKGWITELAQIPEWLFVESYDAVGDLAETVSLLLPEDGKGTDLSLSEWVENRLLPLSKLEDEEKRESVVQWWLELDRSGRFVFTKLLTGSWRVGVSQRLITRALAETLSVQADVITHRLMGTWQPDDLFFSYLGNSDTQDSDVSKPYPFFLAYPMESEAIEDMGPIQKWQAEWKWDGIRAQVIKRQGQVYIWSRGEELVTDQFPEIVAQATSLQDGTTLDGEILAWSDELGGVLDFGQLQRRIGRKKISKKLLKDIPVILMAYDLIEAHGEDIRSQPLKERRTKLEKLFNDSPVDETIRISPLVSAPDWSTLKIIRQESRERLVEGFILKDTESAYGVGRKKGSWWKWKVDPFSADVVLLYAQRGSGRRASLYTDYTFGVWKSGELVPIAKAYSGLNDKEIREIDRFVRSHTVDKFGPVRSVPAEIVMEIHFEGIRRSTRHKSGLALRFPRIARIRTDKSPEDADTLETISELLPQSEKKKKRP